MYDPINNQRFCTLRFWWTGWRHKQFQGNSWRRKRSKKRPKQRSKGRYLHYHQKSTKVIEEPVRPKDLPRQNRSDWTVPHGGCAGNTRDFGRAPEGDPEGDCQGHSAQLRTHLWTLREVVLTGRDGSMPWDVNTTVAISRLTPPITCFKSTSNSPTRNWK